MQYSINTAITTILFASALTYALPAKPIVTEPTSSLSNPDPTSFTNPLRPTSTGGAGSNGGSKVTIQFTADGISDKAVQQDDIPVNGKRTKADPQIKGVTSAEIIEGPDGVICHAFDKDGRLPGPITTKDGLLQTKSSGDNEPKDPEAIDVTFIVCESGDDSKSGSGGKSHPGKATATSDASITAPTGTGPQIPESTIGGGKNGKNGQGTKTWDPTSALSGIEPIETFSHGHKDGGEDCGGMNGGMGGGMGGGKNGGGKNGGDKNGGDKNGGGKNGGNGGYGTSTKKGGNHNGGGFSAPFTAPGPEATGPFASSGKKGGDKATAISDPLESDTTRPTTPPPGHNGTPQ